MKNLEDWYNIKIKPLFSVCSTQRWSLGMPMVEDPRGPLFLVGTLERVNEAKDYLTDLDPGWVVLEPPTIDQQDSSNKDRSQQLNLSENLLRAIDFAANKHRNQRRKNVEATPYINHPIRVALMLSESGETDQSVLMGGVLHDTIEDTETTYAELEKTFSKTIADLVMEVTDDKSLPKQDRKNHQVEHSRNKSVSAKKIKIADKICNLTDIYESPPSTWDLERKRQYLDWAKAVVDSIRGVNQVLDQKFDIIFQKCRDLFL